jgi:hypothetical protein
VSKPPEITDIERDAQRRIIGNEMLANADIFDLCDCLQQYDEKRDEHFILDIVDMFKCAVGIKSHTIITEPGPVFFGLVKDQFMRYNADAIEDDLDRWEECERENREMRAKGKNDE